MTFKTSNRDVEKISVAHATPLLYSERAGRMRARCTCSGFSLIEVVLMVVILAVASVGILSSFRINIMGAASARVNTTAARLAQQRMEVILAQRNVNGFAVFADPCPAAAVCGTLPAGYAITAPTVAVIDATTREITVETTFNGNVHARLVTRVMNYL